MPIFVYKCDECGHAFEVIVYSSDKATQCCEQCNSERITKSITSPSGYYINGDNSASTSPKAHNNRF